MTSPCATAQLGSASAPPPLAGGRCFRSRRERPRRTRARVRRILTERVSASIWPLRSHSRSARAPLERSSDDAHAMLCRSPSRAPRAPFDRRSTAARAHAGAPLRGAARAPAPLRCRSGAARGCAATRAPRRAALERLPDNRSQPSERRPIIAPRGWCKRHGGSTMSLVEAARRDGCRCHGKSCLHDVAQSGERSVDVLRLGGRERGLENTSCDRAPVSCPQPRPSARPHVRQPPRRRPCMGELDTPAPRASKTMKVVCFVFDFSSPGGFRNHGDLFGARTRGHALGGPHSGPALRHRNSSSGL